MSITPNPIVEFNRQLMAEDAVAKGLTNHVKWAAKARVSDMSVIRFLRGDKVTATTVEKLAKPLGHPIERYIVRKASDSAVA